VAWYGHHGDVKNATNKTPTPTKIRIMGRFFILMEKWFNGERSHAGPAASDCKQDALPALAAATC